MRSKGFYKREDRKEMFRKDSKNDTGGTGNHSGQKRRLILIFASSFLVGLILTSFLESYGLPIFVPALALFLLGAFLAKLFVFQ